MNMKENQGNSRQTKCPVILLTRLLWTFILYVTTTSQTSQAQSIVNNHLSLYNISFGNSEQRSIKMYDKIFVNINVSCYDDTGQMGKIHVMSHDDSVAKVQPETIDVKCYHQKVQTVNFTVRGEFLGKTKVKIKSFGKSNRKLDEKDLEIKVIVKNRRLTNIFIIIVAILIIILNFGFGCKLEITIIKEILKKPIPPLIGILCQFILMPILGLSISQAFRMNNDIGFGLLVLATSPGGGGSNVWTLMLGGDLNLSLCMTLFSKIAALFMMPAWLYAVSRLYISETASVPYQQIVTGLLGLLIPCLLGLGLRKWKPRAAEFVERMIKPLAVVFVIFVVTMGSITNVYIYLMWSRYWYIVPSALLVTYLGYALGYLFALITKQGHVRSLTIAIETGIQDTGVAIILLQGTFKEPGGDLAAALPMTAALFTPFPLMVMLGILHGKKCWTNGKCSKLGGPKLNVSNHSSFIEEPTNSDNNQKIIPLNTTDYSPVKNIEC